MNSLFLACMTAACIGLVTANDGTYPDSKITPGLMDPKVTQSTVDATICLKGYTATVRHVTDATKKEVFKRYGIAYSEHSGYEVDHFISLEVGGLNDIENLWPEKYCPVEEGGVSCFGAREKDVVETSLHRRICKHEITLIEAQLIIKTDWLAEYKKIKGLK